MFSGIIETTSRVTGCQQRSGVLQISLERPPAFEDLRAGDSVAVDGVCLTVETVTAVELLFALGPETVRVTEWDLGRVEGREVNLERSLRLGDRLHGHLVTGHVDARARVLEVRPEGETLTLTIDIPPELRPYVWSKGSVALNGVSLTINAVHAGSFQVGLIPETLKRTNLGGLKPGDQVNLEIDNTARGLVHWSQLRRDGEI